MKNTAYKLEVTALPGKNLRYRYTIVDKATGIARPYNETSFYHRDDKRVFIAMTIDAMTCFSTQEAVDKYLGMAAKKNETIDNPDWKFETEIAFIEQ